LIRHVIGDDSETNLRALISDPNVVATEGLAASYRRGYALRGIPPDRDRFVIIRWRDNVTSRRRAEVESQHGLTYRGMFPSDQTGHFFLYELEDTSVAAATRLAFDSDARQVEGVQAIAVPQVLRVRDVPPSGGRLAVRWIDSLSLDARSALERRFTLSGVDPDPQNKWEYDLADSSEATSERCSATSASRTRRASITRGSRCT